jgi:hypothetical protein
VTGLGKTLHKMTLDTSNLCSERYSMRASDDGLKPHLPIAATHRGTKRINFTGRYERHKQWSDFVPGTLICVIEHRANLDLSLNETHEHVSKAKTGEFIYSKYRYFLVLAKHNRHPTVACIYTHNGTGPGSVPEEARFEYLAIKPFAGDPVWINESQYEPLETEQHPFERGDSFVHITETRAVHKGDKVSVVGRVIGKASL